MDGLITYSSSRESSFPNTHITTCSFLELWLQKYMTSLSSKGTWISVHIPTYRHRHMYLILKMDITKNVDEIISVAEPFSAER